MKSVAFVFTCALVVCNAVFPSYVPANDDINSILNQVQQREPLMKDWNDITVLSYTPFENGLYLVKLTFNNDQAADVALYPSTDSKKMKTSIQTFDGFDKAAPLNPKKNNQPSRMGYGNAQPVEAKSARRKKSADDNIKSVIEKLRQTNAILKSLSNMDIVRYFKADFAGTLYEVHITYESVNGKGRQGVVTIFQPLEGADPIVTSFNRNVVPLTPRPSIAPSTPTTKPTKDPTPAPTMRPTV